MLKYVASTAFCVLALLSACEPNGSESMEPVTESGSTISSGKDQTPHKDDITGLDSSAIHALAEDRKSVVSGKSVSVRVDLGGRPLIKTKTKLTSLPST